MVAITRVIKVKKIIILEKMVWWLIARMLVHTYKMVQSYDILKEQTLKTTSQNHLRVTVKKGTKLKKKKN